jgi:hypothetical protein
MNKLKNAIEIKSYDCYGYGLPHSVEELWAEIGLTNESMSVLMLLITVGEMIPCSEVKQWIKDALRAGEIKEWILTDILAEADTTFFGYEQINRTIDNIESIEEEKLYNLFEQVAKTMRYE